MLNKVFKLLFLLSLLLTTPLHADVLLDARVLLAGKTVWVGDSENGGTLESITYNNEMTSAYWQNVEGGGQGQSGNDLVYGVNGNVFYANDEQVADYDITDKTIILQNNSDYLLLECDGDNFRFYFDETKARAYFLSNGNTPSIMTFVPSILSAASTNQKRTIQDN